MVYGWVRLNNHPFYALMLIYKIWWGKTTLPIKSGLNFKTPKFDINERFFVTKITKKYVRRSEQFGVSVWVVSSDTGLGKSNIRISVFTVLVIWVCQVTFFR